jgi:2-dehydro-3-deoxy-D-arabinonate dehydratase
VQIVRFRSGGGPRVGVCAGGRVATVGGVGTLAELWAVPLPELRALLEEVALGCEEGAPLEEVELLAPVDGRSEVWAAGVTYEVSRDARVEESRHAATVYERVYDAERPELFFKAPAWKVAGDGQPIAIREDSTLDVPEPEVALVLNPFGDIAGYTACNDVSSRSIEGENPLYLPQAKIYLGSCALGPAITPAWEVPDPYSMAIGLVIKRHSEVVWAGETSTAKLRRRFDELAGWLFRADRHPDGAVLSTGTCLVPEAPFSLEPGDLVEVSVASVGTVRNPVVRGLSALEQAAPPELRAAFGRTGTRPSDRVRAWTERLEHAEVPPLQPRARS